MRIFVGLDLSLTASGIVALNEDGKVIFSDVVGVKLSRSATTKDRIERMVFIATRVIDTCKKLFKEVSMSNDSATYSEHLTIGVEGYAFSRKGAQNDLGELQGVIKTQVYLALGCIPTVVVATSARKVLFNNGHIAKTLILPELKKRGFDMLRDSNDADAYVVAEFLRLKQKGFQQ